MYLPIYLVEFVEQTIDEGQRLYFNIKKKILIIETERERERMEKGEIRACI